MLPPENILRTWKKFDNFPMETFTKLWFYNKGTMKKQRSISLMREHKAEYGITGNCFDLAIWLLDEFKKDRIEAYPIGHHLNSEHAHVAVIALDEHGRRFLCDLGDQWLCPILIDKNREDYTDEKLNGFFPAAGIQVKPGERDVEIIYHRPNGKFSKQQYDTQAVEISDFMEAAEFSQNLVNPRPLLECRIPFQSETAHWEFNNWESFFSTSKGLLPETKPETIGEWVERINSKTGYDKKFLFDVLEKYKTLFREEA